MAVHIRIPTEIGQEQVARDVTFANMPTSPKYQMDNVRPSGHASQESNNIRDLLLVSFAERRTSHHLGLVGPTGIHQLSLMLN